MTVKILEHRQSNVHFEFQSSLPAFVARSFVRSAHKPKANDIDENCVA